MRRPHSIRHRYRKPVSKFELLPNGEKVLDMLKNRYEWQGRLNSHQTTDAAGGALLRIFFQHAPDYEIAAPGTIYTGDTPATDLCEWRVRRYPRPIDTEKEVGAFVIRLPHLVASMPRDLADWAMEAQQGLIGKDMADGDDLNLVQTGHLRSEIQAAGAVTEIMPVPEGVRRFHL